MTPRYAREESSQRIEIWPNSTSTVDTAAVETLIDSFVNNQTTVAPPQDNSASWNIMGFDIISACYAVTVATGGIIGYVKAGSVPSLAAGLIFGGILGVGTYMTSRNPDNCYLTLGTSAALLGLMGYRFYNSGKFMPAGLVALLSAGIVLRFSAHIAIKAMKNNK